MNKEEALRIFESRLECEERQKYSRCDGTNCDGCDLLYEQGDFIPGEYRKALRIAIYTIRKDINNGIKE